VWSHVERRKNEIGSKGKGRTTFAKNSVAERPRTAAERSEVGWSGSLGIFNVPPDPGRFTATIHHSANHNCLRVVGVVNGEWKSIRKRPVKTAIRRRMNPKHYLQGLHVGIEACQKVVAQPGLLLFVELKSLDQVVARRIKDLQPHRVACSICLLASSHSRTVARPSFRARSRSSKISLCHCGTSTWPGSAAISDQTVSGKATFSGKDICLISDCAIMR